jgi:three-Cys-motif partner protein
VEKHLVPLEDASIMQLIDIPDSAALEAQPWTFLKMASLWSFAHYTYLPIIKRNYTNAIYVDLFSGPGLTVDKASRRKFIGTALLMATIESSQGGFTKCVFVERDDEYANSLEERLMRLRDNDLLTCGEYVVLSGDCNALVDVVAREANIRNSHIMLFVDPFGFNCKFSTLQRFISSGPAFDMFFNLQVGSLARSMGRDASGVTDEANLREFFPDDSWMECKDSHDYRECLKERYIDCLLRYGGTKINRVEPILISGSGDYYYYLLFTSRKEHSGWLRGIERVREMVEAYDYNSIKHYLTGGRTLDDFH